MPAEVALPDEQAARELCLRALQSGPRTRAELARRMARRGVPEPVAAAVLERLGAAGVVDDVLFARLWVDSRHRGRGLAGAALQAELRRKGVAEEVIAQAVSGLDSQEQRATAAALVARRLPATRGQPAAVRLRRLTGLLARKGYAPGLAAAVVREALAADGAGDLPDGPD